MPRSNNRLYNDAKYHAKERDIEFLLTFDEWIKIWMDSGHWHERGRRKGQYQMARFGDKGPYEVGNVKIVTVEENTGEQAPHSVEKWRKSFKPRLVDYLGNLMTIEQAVHAAGDNISVRVAYGRLKRGWPDREAVEMKSCQGQHSIKWPSLQLGQ